MIRIVKAVKYSKISFGIIILILSISCTPNTLPSPPATFYYTNITIAGQKGTPPLNNIPTKPVISISFSAPVDETSAMTNISVVGTTAYVAVAYSFSNNDSTVTIVPNDSLAELTQYNFIVDPALASKQNITLNTKINIPFSTTIDSTDKFPRISDSALLTLIQQQTFKYFWDFGHPVSGLARERNNSADVVTTGGSGFGVMSTLVGVERNFISRADGLNRLTTIVSFLSNKAHRYHGAFPHWMNGATGETVPFSPNDDGADLVETSYMMEGLLCARQYFNSTSDMNEVKLRDSINLLWNGVQWNWFRQNNQNVLYWHWSPDKAFIINQPISGWDEAMIVYALAASSNVDSNTIPKIVYDNGWALNGGIINGKSFYGIQLPLGPDYGGPLFFAHYSFLGINPNNLTDAYANYWTQNVNHSKINYTYCVTNPRNYFGYSNQCWGLTASDDNISGYSAHAPDNDLGVITPTAAVSSLPYTPTESMNAIRFFYYTLGDKLWGQYGFRDAFNLTNVWFADSFLAIDQGPEIIMIENYRTRLLWNLFMSCPEIKKGMKNLGFQSPNLN